MSLRNLTFPFPTCPTSALKRVLALARECEIEQGTLPQQPLSLRRNSGRNVAARAGCAAADGATRNDIRARNEVVRGRRAPKAEVDSGVSRLVDAGDAHGGAGDASRGVALNFHLQNGIVELGLTLVGTMQTNMLAADEILPVRQRVGDGEPDVVLAVTTPGGRAKRFSVAGGAEQGLVHLVPVSVVLLVGDGGVVNGTDIHLGWARVLHSSSAVGLFEANLVSCRDGEHLRRGHGSLVGGKVLVKRSDGSVGDILELGWHVGVLMLPDVRVC